MMQGTTPTHRFTIPFDASFVRRVRVSYSQNGTCVLIKEDPECHVEGNVIELKLSQEETLKFDEFSSVLIQVRVLTVDGDALATDPIRVSCGAVLDNEVLE